MKHRLNTDGKKIGRCPNEAFVRLASSVFHPCFIRG